MFSQGETVKQKRGFGLINNLIDKLPFEAHISGYQFCGPGTKLKERLLKGQTGVNALDSACLRHDLAYSQSKNLEDRHRADAELISAANQRLFARDTPLRERLASATVSSIIGLKKRFGMGLKRTKKRNKKKRGGFIGPILGGIGAASSLLSGASNIYKNYRTIKQNAKMLGEIKKHNQAINSIVSGRGLYLRPYKQGKGYRRRRRKKKKH